MLRSAHVAWARVPAVSCCSGQSTVLLACLAQQATTTPYIRARDENAIAPCMLYTRVQGSGSQRFNYPVPLSYNHNPTVSQAQRPRISRYHWKMVTAIHRATRVPKGVSWSHTIRNQVITLLRNTTMQWTRSSARDLPAPKPAFAGAGWVEDGMA